MQVIWTLLYISCLVILSCCLCGSFRFEVWRVLVNFMRAARAACLNSWIHRRIVCRLLGLFNCSVPINSLEFFWGVVLGFASHMADVSHDISWMWRVVLFFARYELVYVRVCDVSLPREVSWEVLCNRNHRGSVLRDSNLPGFSGGFPFVAPYV